MAQRVHDSFVINAYEPYKSAQLVHDEASRRTLDEDEVSARTRDDEAGVESAGPTTNSEQEELNLRPVIGILTQEPGNSLKKALIKHNMKNYSSYVAASYVKSMESAGARVVPIMINEDQEYYEKLGSSLNGIVFPGGGSSITNSSGYGAAGDALYQIVMASNARGKPLPLWATCLGFEMLVYLAAGRRKPLTRCSANNRADPLVFLSGWQNSQVWKDAPAALTAAVQTENITSNFHKFCVTPETFDRLGVSENFSATSVNTDENGLMYVSTIEHKKYPIFGTQWHPEKNSYEWRIDYQIPHSANAVDLERYMSKVFVQQARRNNNTFSSEEELESRLIYNFSAVYAAQLYKSSFQQIYLFD
ncbi:Peptidase C26 [Trinorchestia longiramus]|nr:Peptidase C26 [Trinorchestia longiramus]